MIDIYLIGQRVVWVGDRIPVVAGANEHQAAGFGPEVDFIGCGQIFDDGPLGPVGLVDFEGDDLVPAIDVGEFNPNHLPQAMHPWPGSHNHGLALKIAGRRLHNFVHPLEKQTGDRGVGVDSHTQSFGLVGVGHGGLVGVGIAGEGIVSNHAHILDLNQGMNLAGFLRTKNPGVDAVVVLLAKDGFHRLAVLFRAEDEIPSLMPTTVAADMVGKVGKYF